ncbi:MAG: alpha-mannosidase [Planctomycetes bacterium]|nr:alpha-mannosidase [Planctomycetota bacterium]
MSFHSLGRVLIGLSCALLLAAVVPAQRDLSSEADRTLYCVGYAHLDTQWRWEYPTTIDEYLRRTLDDNFELFERYPGYVFTFSGAHRYALIREYYPERWQRLQQYVAAGRWRVGGSSVDECDVNSPCAESLVRQVLYGNEYFRRAFGTDSVDFMLPDCFGFPADLPSVLAHCGVLGFSTQKLTWGSAVGIPFDLGVWQGPDGNGVVAALNPGSYASAVRGRVDLNAAWADRVRRNGERYGVWADFHYYGVGDVGGAPRERDVRNYVASVDQPDSLFHVELGSSDQLFRDLTPPEVARLPRYQGDLLLTQHSAGSLTSQAYMKRWNRKNECLGDAAERAAVTAAWLGAGRYPREALERSWIRMLGSQMHDMLPGTSTPAAYEFCWNDEIVALNGFAGVLTQAVDGVARGLDTRAQGVPLIVYNPLAIARQDPVEATLVFGGDAPAAVRAFGPDGAEVPVQVLGRGGNELRVLLLADVAPNSWTVFDVRPTTGAPAGDAALKVDARSLENADYRVTLDDNGDVASIVDKRNGGRELLSGPARLVFTHERPEQWPAWNMDWSDRQQPPLGAVAGPVQARVVESGPVRVALEIRREARDSIVTQTLRLSAGTAGRRLEFATHVDWQSAECALRAAFPLTVSNPEATYDLGLGTIRRGNNAPKKYEVPAHEWIDLTDAGGAYGVSILNDCKTGSDKPADDELRLTLLYTPGVRKAYQDQHSQDWGRHDMLYALYGHPGDWAAARTEWQGRRINQPLRAFQPAPHAGPLGRSLSMLTCDSDRVDVRALKLAEGSDEVIVRVQELHGQAASRVALAFAAPVLAVREVDGQERAIAAAGAVALVEGRIVVDLTPYQLRTFALQLGAPGHAVAPVASAAVALAYDRDVASTDAHPDDGAFDAHGRSLPAEQLPASVVHGGIRFEMGPTADGQANAVTCAGQSIALHDGDWDHVHLLVAADERATATFAVGDVRSELVIPCWTGFVGQWDLRRWDGPSDRDGAHVVGFEPGFVHREPIAWFATHRHLPQRGNDAYRFAYLFDRSLVRPAGARELVLPADPRIKLLAVSVSREGAGTRVAAPLYDDFTGRGPLELRHVYPPPPKPLEEGLEPIGRVAVDRADRFEALSMGPPSATDYADAAAGHDVVFRVVDGRGRYPPHPSAGAIRGAFPRLNDGVVAGNDDDTSRCVWYDQEGRFYADLRAAVPIAAVRTYSWHRSNRAPQRFSLWGATGDQPPDATFQHGHDDGWTLLGVVDSSPLGNGGKHGSIVAPTERARSLGEYRYLLWVARDVGEGTFFTEIDVDVAKRP